MQVKKCENQGVYKDWIEINIYINAGLDSRDDPNIDQLIDVVSDFIVSQLDRGVIVEDDVFLKAYCTPEECGNFLTLLEQFLKELNARHGDYLEFGIDTRRIMTEDWSQSWKEYFKPLKIGKNLVIKPTWEDYVPHPKEIVIEIDPGQAFGTGTHASTRLCLELMERHVRANALKKALDVGTGTGILGIALAKLGVNEVLMIDVDPVAVDVARKNVVLNRVHHVCATSSTPIWIIEDEFDLIVANLDQNTILLLAEELSRVLKSHGILLVSGIIQGQDRAVIQKFVGLGMEIQERKNDPKDPEWLALTFCNNKNETETG